MSAGGNIEVAANNPPIHHPRIMDILVWVGGRYYTLSQSCRDIKALQDSLFFSTQLQQHFSPWQTRPHSPMSSQMHCQAGSPLRWRPMEASSPTRVFRINTFGVSRQLVLESSRSRMVRVRPRRGIASWVGPGVDPGRIGRSRLLTSTATGHTLFRKQEFATRGTGCSTRIVWGQDLR
ncbi:hypothetical protein BD779DRAFT_1546708 [Infundibulicybe gibba]|nr:hypothetical protein BD779DRAFT_1546708 [Infundibulicybe gibba]